MKEFGIDIQWTARYQYQQGGNLHIHDHSFYQMIYFVDGSGRFSLDGQDYPIAPGAFFFIKPHVRHGFTAHRASVIKTLDLKFHIINKELELLVAKVPGSHLDDGQNVRALLEAIRNEGLTKRPYFSHLAALHLLQLLYLIARSQTELTQQQTASLPVPAGMTYEPQEAARQVESMIQAHYAEDITLHSIAAQLGYDRSYLSRVFRSSYDCTFSQYLRRLRIGKARELLADTSFSLKEIAERTGFKTIYHFNRVFKELEGVSPGGWRQKEQGGVRKDVYFGE
ncbi:helix-turn-helix domain-containing protein [Paenibacillus sp. GCM10012307]|uniref:Helix-turn-helix transcriptional regulator n=1 Tax=Paenibacillus roseus TaxID=2798579 RepID=A0A934MR55_9BACL|nr:AraC family transcriptional regulator [Paenibacillus roseus]MBJ6363896.1 helix-turn-helix transcriptional regulator [Paenibacillus roseus]